MIEKGNISEVKSGSFEGLPGKKRSAWCHNSALNLLCFTGRLCEDDL
jgi:hypothetical protein